MCDYILQYNKIHVYNSTTICTPVQKYKFQDKSKSFGTEKYFLKDLKKSVGTLYMIITMDLNICLLYSVPKQTSYFSGLGNAIYSVFCRTFSVNKDEGRYSNYLFILPISSVIGKLQTVYVKKG